MDLDIIGDIHGCFRELKELTLKLGYDWSPGFPVHPERRKLAFVGDLTDRGPNSLGSLKSSGLSLLIKTSLLYPGNHCNKLYRYFLGNRVKIAHGLETTVAEFHSFPAKSKNNQEKIYQLV